MDDVTKKIISYVKESEQARIVLSRIHSIDIESVDVQKALVEELDLKLDQELIDQNLTSDQIVNILKDFNFKQFHPDILATIELDGSIVPRHIPRILTEKIIKHKNEIWEIHKYDDDPFPSDPHAHNYESGLKLDLSDGKLYQKRKVVDQINKKTLLQIRNKAGDIKLPELSI